MRSSYQKKRFEKNEKTQNAKWIKDIEKASVEISKKCLHYQISYQRH